MLKIIITNVDGEENKVNVDLAGTTFNLGKHTVKQDSDENTFQIVTRNNVKSILDFYEEKFSEKMEEDEDNVKEQLQNYFTMKLLSELGIEEYPLKVEKVGDDYTVEGIKEDIEFEVFEVTEDE